MTKFIGRLIRALKLDPLVYSEIKQDRSVLIQSLLLALISSIASGMGNSGGYSEKILFLSLMFFGGWFFWSILIYVLGTKVFPEPETETSLIDIFRVTGFAATPGLLKILAFLPAFTGIILFGATVWMLGCTVVASKQALHYQSMPRAMGITLLSWISYQLILFLI